MKKILIDLLKLSNLNCGLGQVALNFAKTLSQTETEFEKHYLVPRSFKGKFGNNVVYHTKSELKQFLKGNQFSLWHCIHQEPEILPADNTKILLTIHDLNFLSEKNSEKAAKRLLKIQSIVNKCTHLTFISEFSKSVVLNHLKTNSLNCDVIYNGVKTESNQSKPALETNQEFFFTIGVLKPKKNFAVLIPVIKYFPDTLLIIAGEKKGAYYKQIKKLIKKEKLEKQVVFAGNVSELEKTWLYRNCKAFLFPSLYEGFGLPVIEAMQNKAPAIISKLSSLPEIGSDCAYYFDNFDASDMATTIKASLTHFSASHNIAQKNMIYADQFNWERNVNSYINLYLNLIQKD